MSGSIGVMSITPFTAEGSIDEGALERHLTRLASHPLTVCLCGHGTGEGHALSLEEKAAVYRIGVRVVKDRTNLVGAGIGLTGDTDTALEQVERLSGTGVDAVQVYPPRTGALRPSDRELERYFEELVRASRCPVIVADNPAVVGYELGPGLIRRVLERCPEVVGVNYSAPTSPGQLVELVASRRDRAEVRTGLLHHFTTMGAAGGAGAICFDANVAPGLVTAAWVAVNAGGSGSGSPTGSRTGSDTGKRPR